MRATLVLGLLIVASGSAVAQTPPPAGQAGDLVVPPELRGAPAARPAGPSRAKPKGGALTADQRRVTPAYAARSPATADPDRPLGFGVHVQGGSGDTRFYSSTSTAADSQGAGSGVTAGVKFGF